MGKVTTVPIADIVARADYVVRLADGAWKDLRYYAGAISAHDVPNLTLPTIIAPANLDYLSDGDVVRLAPSGDVQVLYRRDSQNNTILTTERCNSYCLMCSQPPKTADDSWRVEMIMRLIELIDPGAKEIVISGGEPTLLGDSFFRIVQKLSTTLPNTALHILSNGRTFRDIDAARDLARIRHPDLMVGIPLYSDIDDLHDYVVQADGAWSETLAGFYNLAACGVRLELRVVLHQQTYERLPQLAEFIYRNLPFVQHVALMGLEMFGLTNVNLPVLWVDPYDYSRELEVAATALALRGMNVSIYNHQLCVLPKSLWPFARKSISDWKNVYVPQCEGCEVREFCGGFFQSATKRHSEHIRPVRNISPMASRSLREFAGMEPPIETYISSSF